MLRTKEAFFTGLVIFILMTLVACTSGQPGPAQEGAGGAQQTEAPEPLVIGAVFSFTGQMAAYDMPPREGVLLAVDVLNEKGGVMGRPVVVREIDGKTDPATIGNAARQLIDEGAEIIIAPCDFDIGSQASIAAQEKGLVGVSTCASSPLYSSTVLGDKQFTIHMWNNNQAAGGVEYAYKELGWRKAYFVTDTSMESSRSTGRYWQEHWAKMNGENLGEDTYLQGDMDFSAQIQRIRSLPEQPDGLFIASSMPDIGTIIRQVRTAGIEIPIMGYDSYDTVEFYEVVGELGNNIYFTTQAWIGPEMGEDMVKFIELYKNKFNKEPEIGYIATGWDVVMMYAEAIEKAGSTDGKALAKAMEEAVFTNLLGGALDWTSAEEGHEPLREVTIVKIVGGEPSYVGRAKPESPPAP